MKWKHRHETWKFQGVEAARIGLNQPWNETDYSQTCQSMHQRTQSENHGFGQFLHEQAVYHDTFKKRLSTVADVGGPFYTERQRAHYGGIHVSLHTGTSASSVERKYTGMQLAYTQNPVFPPKIPYTDLELFAFGNKARALINPVNPAVSAGQDIGELRDTGGVPSIPTNSIAKFLEYDLDSLQGIEGLKKRIQLFRDLGSEYLNIEFGWSPVLHDVRAAAIAAKRTIKILRQYERNRGKPVRRRFQFPDVIDFASTDMGSHTPYPPISSAFYSSYFGKLTLERRTVSKVWFAGSLTYYVTPGIHPGKLAKYEAAADRLLDARLTPELIWQLTPWSWLTDWFFDIGSFITNLDALILDGSVMWYGYVMAHRKTTDVYTLGGYLLNSHPSPDLIQVFTTETKQRVRATPFGFGLSPNSFTMKQWSILAALGISRV